MRGQVERLSDVRGPQFYFFYSPAQLMFGRSQQLLLPQPASAFQPIDYEQAAAKLDDKFHSSLPHYDRDKVQLPRHVLQDVLVSEELGANLQSTRAIRSQVMKGFICHAAQSTSRRESIIKNITVVIQSIMT